jgi:GNAT superfamily N-acetyltransferase
MSRMFGERCNSQANATDIGGAPSRAAPPESASDCNGVKPPSGKNGMGALATFDVSGRLVSLRHAVAADLPDLVELLAADQLGAGRECPEQTPEALRPYREAFDAIAADPAHLLLVAADGQRPIGTMQLSFIPGLARRGAWRAQIEAVRVHEDARNLGIGAWMIGWAIDEARRRGCALVQLTTDKRRTDAHRFYERLGFVASHEGMKLQSET